MVKSRPFSFKRFTVNQERAAMKVGTDGVLLGAWCTVEPAAEKALDIGTGTGVIALMLAQRGEGWGMRVDALEPEEGAFADASGNVAASEWKDNVTVFNKTLQHHAVSGKYGLIVCNPPYFVSSLLPPAPGRTTARHNVSLGRQELVSYAAGLCAEGGRFAVIIPAEQAADYIIEGDLHGFSLARRTDVRTGASSPPKRVMLEFLFGPAEQRCAVTEELVIETAPMDYTPEYIALTRDFYLKF